MLRLVTCLLLSLLVSLPARAADPVYEVEVIAFVRSTDPALHGGEDASLSSHRPSLDSGFELDMLGGLPLNNLRLGNVAARLKAGGKYQILLHQAWRQPVGSSSSAPWLHLAAGSVTVDGNSQPELEGLVKLYRNPNLMLDADLLYRHLVTAPATAAAAPSQETQYAGSADAATPSQPAAAAQPALQLREYPLVGSSRVMDGQISYYDSPMLSLLVQAWPVK